MSGIRAPGLPKGMTLITIKELTTLRRRAVERADYLAALKRLDTKRLHAMRDIRSAGDDYYAPFARGYLQYEHDLGEALLDVMRERGDL